MFSLLSGVPGVDEVRAFVRKVDTARHQGVANGCILELDLQNAPPESAGFDPVAVLSGIVGSGRPMLLRDVVAALHRAAEDPRVAGLIARVQIDAAPPGPVQELREAIAAFTAAKPSLAWAETYPGTLSYYLASAFGEVWMQPSGTVGLIGFATNALFLRDALDKAGVEAQFVARGEYKSAANLFTQDGYTEAHREADTALVESLRTQVWDAVASSRGIERAELDALAETGGEATIILEGMQRNGDRDTNRRLPPLDFDRGTVAIDFTSLRSSRSCPLGSQSKSRPTRDSVLC